MPGQPTAIVHAVAAATAHANALLQSLCSEHEALLHWDMDKLNGELENRQALVARLHSAVETLSRQALPNARPGEVPADELKTQLNQVIELAASTNTELSEAWEALRDLGQTLEEQQRINASMIILGRQVAEQTMSQLLSEFGGTAPASPTYSAKGFQSSAEMPGRLLGIA